MVLPLSKQHQTFVISNSERYLKRLLEVLKLPVCVFRRSFEDFNLPIKNLCDCKKII